MPVYGQFEDPAEVFACIKTSVRKQEAIGNPEVLTGRAFVCVQNKEAFCFEPGKVGFGINDQSQMDAHIGLCFGIVFFFVFLVVFGVWHDFPFRERKR